MAIIIVREIRSPIFFVVCALFMNLRHSTIHQHDMSGKTG